MSKMMLLPDVPVALLDGSDSVISLRDFCSGRIGVIDLWHTKCTKCPAGLEKFNTQATKFSSTEVMFIACALSLGEGNKEDVADIGPDSWGNLHHIFVETENKDTLKAAFGYSAVPFYVMFDKTGAIIKSEDSKAFDYSSELTKLLESVDSNNENTPQEINASTTVQQISVAAIKSIGQSDDAVHVGSAEHVFALDEDF
jgi:hypothetical protein